MPAAALALLSLAPAASVAARDFASEVPPDLVGVGVVENLGGTIPLDVEFKDEAGVRVTFRELMASGKPTIVTPVFYNCPMLCTRVLNGLTDGLSELEWSIGEEFNVITYSFNPEETPDLAAAKRKSYLEAYGRDSAKRGWRFLTGSAESIAAMNDALGFYTRRTEDGNYAHTAAIMFITPEGRISRYMDDVMFAPRDLRFALVEASEGTIGSPMDQFLLMMCYQYDPDSKSFTPSAWKIMRGGAALTAVLLAGGLSFFWIRDLRRRAGGALEHEEDAPGSERDGSKGATHAG